MGTRLSTRIRDARGCSPADRGDGRGGGAADDRADGDGDGVADPRDLDDAAWTAARYLCADAQDLATVAGWNAAVYSYNHDNAYVVNVANAANTYAQRAAA